MSPLTRQSVDTPGRGAARPRPHARLVESVRRREILDVATEVFAEKGIVAATVRDIGDRAGILSGSLYHHFASKDQMISEILVPVIDAQIAAYDRIVAETDDPVEVVRGVIAAAVAQTASNPGAARILRNDEHHLRELPGLEVLVSRRTEVLRRWQSAVTKAIDAGWFRDDVDPRLTTFAIADVVLGAYRYVPPVGKLSARKVTDELTALILDGLVAR